MFASEITNRSFYASAVNNIHPFSSDALYELLKKEFKEMTDSLKDYFASQIQLNSPDPRITRYELFDILPSLSDKLSVVVKSLNFDYLKSRDVEFVDYTCSQGMSAVIIIEKLIIAGFDASRLKRVTIIDPNQQHLEYASLHLNAFIPGIEIRTICKPYLDILPQDLSISSMYCVHLFGDIIERYKYLSVSFATTIRASRLLYDCFVFYKDVQINKDTRKAYASNSGLRPSVDSLFYWSRQLTDIIEPRRIAGELKKDSHGQEWAFLILGNHSLSNLFYQSTSDNANALIVDDYITSHITHNGELFYDDSLLPQTKPFDKKDYFRAFNEKDLTIIEENFLIYKIADLYSSNPEAFRKIVARYQTLADNGCYEAYNNLGVIKIMSEYQAEEDGSDEYILDEANELFSLAAEHGSASAIVNLLSYYCSKNNHEQANYFIDRLIENNEDRGYWERAISLFLGIHEPQDIEKSRDYFAKLLDTMPGEEWPRQGYRNLAVYNMARLDYEHASLDEQIRILRELETCNSPYEQQEILKAVILAKLGLGKQAIKIFHKLEEDEHRGGNKFVLFYDLAICYMYGIGCDKNYKKAESYFKKTIEKNSNQEPFFPRGYRGIGNLYFTMGKNEQAEKYYSLALEYDHEYYCAARANLAVLKKENKFTIATELLSSQKGCKSCHEANRYDETERLCPKCQFWLLSNHQYNENDINNTFQNHLYAPALQGYPQAQFVYGKTLINNDKQAAVKWLALAAEQGYSEAQSYLYLIEKNECLEKLPSNQALRWLALSAKSGNADSQLMLYWEHQNDDLPGNGIKWLVNAATNGSSMAEYILGSHLYNDGYVEEGLQLLVGAANKGQNDALSFLDNIKGESLELRKRIVELQLPNSELTTVSDEEINHPELVEIDGFRYSKDKKRAISFYPCYQAEAHVQEGTVCICDNCINDLYSEIDYNYLDIIHLPKSLRYIGKYAFNAYIKDIRSESDYFIVEHSALFTKDKKVLVRYFGDDEEYSVPNGVEKIEGGGLWASNLKRVVLPESLTVMNGNPFLRDTMDYFALSVTSLSPCFSTTDGFVTDIIDKCIVIYLGQEKTVTIPNGIEVLGRDCFFATTVETIYLPRSVTTVDESSFYYCFHLKQIHVPKGSRSHFLEVLPDYVHRYIVEDEMTENETTGVLNGDRVPIPKDDAAQISRYLNDNAVRCFYHFTDRKNLESIRRNGGLFSWSYCVKNGIDIPVPGGSSSSRSLDQRHHLEDYVRLSFCMDHPMAFRLQEGGADLVLLKIKTDVATFKDTLFSDINATDNNHHHGDSFNDLKKVDIKATKQTYVSKESPIFKKHQAEIMVKTHIPLEYIINLDNPLPLI